MTLWSVPGKCDCCGSAVRYRVIRQSRVRPEFETHSKAAAVSFATERAFVEKEGYKGVALQVEEYEGGVWKEVLNVGRRVFRVH